MGRACSKNKVLLTVVQVHNFCATVCSNFCGKKMYFMLF